jgi:hypothetical protein
MDRANLVDRRHLRCLQAAGLKRRRYQRLLWDRAVIQARGGTKGAAPGRYSAPMGLKVIAKNGMPQV